LRIGWRGDYFGLRGTEVTVVCRKLHNKELNDQYCSPNIIQVIKSIRMRWTEHLACMGIGDLYPGFLVVKLEGKRTLGRPRRRWEDNNKMDLQEVEGGSMD